MDTNAKTAEGWVCTDCYVLIANGDTPEDWTDERTEEWLASLPDVGTMTAGRMFTDCGHTADDDAHYFECETLTFSWSRCDSCHSTLGGSRYAVTFWL